MDAQHRSLLEGVLHARACTSLAARGADDVDGGSKCGVYVGISGADFLIDHVKPAATELNAFILPGNVLSVAAGRVSFVFGFRGRSLAVDTACSSSIVSTHAATEAIARGDVDDAASCGVSAVISVLTSGLFNAAGMLAPDGRCKTLDAAANGYVRAEARGVLILEATGVAPRRGPVAVVGAAVNQDGRSSSLTAPHGPSQRAAIRAALRVAELDGSRVATLQMHGTGTALGDPIEIGSALAAFERRADAPSLALEAAKSRVGHTETAAGVVGVAQPLENLARLAVAPVAHLTAVNAHVRSVIRSALGDRDVRAPAMPRQDAALAGSRAENDATCGVSGFAFQGTNGHVIARRVVETNERARRVGGLGAERSAADRARYWVVPETHASLREARADGKNRVAIVAFLDPRTHAHLWDHRVMRRALFPGAGLFELALCGAATMGGATDATPRDPSP